MNAARSGDQLDNPVTGLRTVFRATSEETAGELLQVEWIGDAFWTTGPDHVHRLQEERFEVLSGKLGLRVDGVGWNAGDEEVHVLVDFRPALRTAIAFESLAALAREGKTNRAGAPRNPLLAALVLRHFEDEIYFVRPPLALQRVVLGPLAALARVLGYRAEHTYDYSARKMPG